jgi:hypothetical protein
MGRVDPDESVTEALESLQLEGRLDAQHECILIQCQAYGRGIKFVFNQYINIVLLEPISPKAH